MGRGSNSNGVRRYKERLVLSTIHRLDGASKADLATPIQSYTGQA